MSSLYLIINKPLVNEFEIQILFSGILDADRCTHDDECHHHCEPPGPDHKPVCMDGHCSCHHTGELTHTIKWVFKMKFHFSFGRLFPRKVLISYLPTYYILVHTIYKK